MTSTTPSGIAYDDAGSGGPALLLMPGWCAPRTAFDELASRLAGSHRSLALDWRGHGGSVAADGDFGAEELVADALAVIADSGVEQVVPVGMSHAGWVAIELRRRLGAERVPGLILLDWMVLGAPPPFLGALEAMAAPATTRAVVEQVQGMWLGGLDLPALTAYVATMAGYPDEMWARAAREIGAAFASDGVPVDVIAALSPPPPTLHLYAQPADPAYLEAQQRYAADNPWFSVERLDAASHFPTIEVPDAVTTVIEDFTSTRL